MHTFHKVKCSRGQTAEEQGSNSHEWAEQGNSNEKVFCVQTQCEGLGVSAAAKLKSTSQAFLIQLLLQIVSVTSHDLAWLTLLVYHQCLWALCSQGVTRTAPLSMPSVLCQRKYLVAAAVLEVSGSPVWPASTLLGNARLKG